MFSHYSGLYVLVLGIIFIKSQFFWCRFVYMHCFYRIAEKFLCFNVSKSILSVNVLIQFGICFIIFRSFQQSKILMSNMTTSSLETVMSSRGSGNEDRKVY